MEANAVASILAIILVALIGFLTEQARDDALQKVNDLRNISGRASEV